MNRVARIPLTLTPQPEGGFTVTCPVMPEFVTEGDSVEEVMARVQDALSAAIELYQDLEKPLPVDLILDIHETPIEFEFLTLV